MTWQSQVQVARLGNRHRTGDSEPAVVLRVAVLVLLTRCRDCEIPDLLPYREGIAVAGIDAKVLQQSTACFRGQAADREVNGGFRNGQVVIVIIPYQNFDFILLARSDNVDIRLSANSTAHDLLGR